MIYFIGGLQNREFKYFDTIKKIRDENTGIAENFFDADIKEEEKFLEKISFNSIFSSEELVVLKRSEKLKDLEKTLDYIAGLDLNKKEIVIDYAREDGKIPAKLNKKLESLKKEKKMEVFLFLKEDDKDIKKYIQAELGISSTEADMLLEMIGKNPFKVKNEVEKIKIYLNGEKFEISKMKNIVSVQKEYKIYEMTENIFMGKAQEVIDYLETTKEYMGILYQLYNELEIMYKLSSLKASGRNISGQYNTFKGQFEEIKEVFKSNGRIPNYYSVFKKIEKLRNYSNRNLKKLVFWCWEIEKDIKTGKIGMDTGVEMLIMEIVNCHGKK